MTTAAGALDAMRARLEAAPPTDPRSGGPVPFRWPGEDSGPLADTAAPFVYVDLVTDPGFIASFGGGRGANRYRNPGQLDAYCFVPRGWGVRPAMVIAEAVAARLRSYRDADVSCFEATVHPGGDGASLKPPGLDSAVGAYFWARASAGFFFDQIG